VTSAPARELVLSHFSLGRHHPIADRVRLASANGFDGIGLYVGHYAALEREGAAPGPLRELLADHHIALREIEVVAGLGADGPGGAGAAEREAVAFRMADEFGCRYLQTIGPGGDDLDGATRAFGGLCDRAADHGLVVGLEFLPFTDITDVTHARAIVEGAGRTNGGLCVDVWHHERGARDLSAIAALPGEMIMAIQLNDGSAVAADTDYYTDCLSNRVAPGDGEFDLVGFMAAVRGTGTGAPVSVEVCSASGWADPEPHVRRIADGARRFV
jgi:sugar phosphate isomerase/epimerase